MRIDIGPALATVAEPGVPRGVLDRLDERVASAHERIVAGRAERDHGYAALALPETTDLDAIRAAVDEVPTPEAVLTVGIGGSALGAGTLTDALDSPVRAARLDNVDPAHTRRTLDGLPLADTAVVVASRSGTTTETLATLLVVRNAFERASVDWTERTIAITGETGPLARLAERHDLTTLPVPPGVPGRYSLLSPVGLTAAALCGHDIEAVLAGGAAAADRLSESLFETPAYAYGATAYALEERGVAVNAMCPYAEALETFAEWFAQLWAESLGKDGRGQLPAKAMGATDQHSQLQRYRAGPPNTMVTFLAPEDRPSCPVPDASDLPAHVTDTDLRTLIDAECAATAASLAVAGRPHVRMRIDAIDERSLGELCYTMEAACVLVGELAAIDPFDQPAVEWGKEATERLLSGDSVDDIAAVESLVVEE
jgi:glucose-6-phosphate isomerase